MLISLCFPDSENLRNLDIWSRRCVSSRLFKYNSSGSVYEGSSNDQCLDSCASDQREGRGVLRFCSLLGSETQAQTRLRSAPQSVQSVLGRRRTATPTSRHRLKRKLLCNTYTLSEAKYCITVLVRSNTLF